MDFKEFSAKTSDDAITLACQEFGITSDKLEYEIISEGKDGFLGIGSKDAVIRAKVKELSTIEKARTFLNDIFAAMQLPVNMEIKFDEIGNNLDIDLIGDDMGILIGKRGQTLDSLQYLLSLIVNKDVENYIRVKVDTEDYRKRRKETLENLAKNIAYKVKRTRKTISLEPMNPYERRVIHSALQGDRSIVTYSEGDEPYRHVVVSLKR